MLLIWSCFKYMYLLIAKSIASQTNTICQWCGGGWSWSSSSSCRGNELHICSVLVCGCSWELILNVIHLVQMLCWGILNPLQSINFQLLYTHHITFDGLNGTPPVLTANTQPICIISSCSCSSLQCRAAIATNRRRRPTSPSK